MVRHSKKPSGHFRKLLQPRIDEANPQRKLIFEETKYLTKLETIAAKLKRIENVQNHPLKTWLSEDRSAQIYVQW